MQILFPVALLLIFYFLVLPRQRRAQAQRNLGATVEVGDQVVMAGGMIGTLVSRDGERALVEVAPAIEIEFLVSAIVRRLDPVYDDGDTDDAHDGYIGDDAFPDGDGAPHVDPAAPTVPVDVTPPPIPTKPDLSKPDLSATDDLRRDDAPRGEEPPVVPPQRGDMT